MSKPTIKPASKATGKPVPAKKQKITKGQQFAAAQADAAGTLRVNANIRAELHRKLKVYAAMQGVSMGDLIEEWIEGLPNIAA